jgi:CRISPR-associated endonuclease Csn1
VERIFGFDIGTTSIGFAAIDFDKDRSRGRILRLGVRIFPEARDPDGTPLNQTRRAKRMARRQLRRRKQRRRTVNELLAAAGLLPPFGSEEWRELMAKDPYELRDCGLSEALTPHELGRALYHLGKRRHFKGRDIEETDQKDADSPDEKAAATNRDATLAALKASGGTLGQWLARRPNGERKRGYHATREVVREEFDKLWTAQAAYHPVLSNDVLRGQVADAMFAQRPVFWRKSTLGHCRFEPGAPLCLKASWLSQQRRMLEKLNNLALAGGNVRPLDPEERAAILARLQTQASMSWGGVREVLKPLYKARDESSRNLKFNLEVGGEPKLLGNAVEQKLAAIFGDAWGSHAHKDGLRREIAQRLWDADYGHLGKQRVVILPADERARRRAKMRDDLIADFDVTSTQAQALSDMKLPTGWEPYSSAALEKVLPELEQGVRFGALVNGPEWENWRDNAFPNRDRPTGEFHDRLPSPRNSDEARRIAQLRNPTVVRAQNELRKVVNNLIDMFGKPDLIRVELARDVGKSKREREEIKSALRKQERRRKEAEKDLQSKGIAIPSRADIEKWLLWKESQEQCPYTGDHIGFDDLFRTNRYQVEHIWPRSKSLDDSFRNKTLCRTDVNVAKGNRTPFEHFEHQAETWNQIKLRLDKLMGKDGMPPGKVKRFLAETLPDDFAARQLNDTGYAARQAKDMVKRLWPDVGVDAPVSVQAVNGRVTAQLRKRWGLNNILSDDGEKTRADHRHHAIDAVTVACAHGGYAQRLAAYFKEESEGRTPHLAEPWPTIRADAASAVSEIIVSHRVRKKVSGPLHKETTYGDTGRNDAKTGAYRLFVTRKRLEAMTKAEVFSEDPEVGIVDPQIRKDVQEWVRNHGGDPKKAFETYPQVNGNSQEIRKARLTTKQQPTLMARASTGYADLGANHHISIYRRVDGKIGYEVVSLFEATRRLARRQPVVQRNSTDGSAFLMSLAAGETIQFETGSMKGLWIVQGVWASGQVVLCASNDAANATITRPMPNSIITGNARKVAVDPIGRVRPSGD